VTVAGIARPEGPGAYGLRPAIFAPMPTASVITGSEQINVVRISASADPLNLDAGRSAVAPLQSALTRLSDPSQLTVHAVKAAEVRSQEDQTQFIVAMLLGLSALIVAAGVTLVINLMLTLAEERRPRLALLRAMGLTRRGLVILSVLEGALYSLVAAAAGTAAGILAGIVVADRLAAANAATYPGIDFRFAISIKPATLAVAFAAGSLITLATVFVAAWRSSRLGIAAAIRDLPEPARESRRRWPIRAVAGALGLAGAFSIFQAGSLGWLIGGLLLIIALAMVVGGGLPDRLRPHSRAVDWRSGP
jgi:putative ABC transport system permease protein